MNFRILILLGATAVSGTGATTLGTGLTQPPASGQHPWVGHRAPVVRVSLGSHAPPSSSLLVQADLPLSMVTAIIPTGTATRPPSEVAPLVLHGRHLNEVLVSTVAELTAAVGNSAVDKILVAAGTYSFTTSCAIGEVYHRFTICIDRALTIEAEVPGAVVLIATPWKRAFAIQSGGTVELIGLNITGGLALSRGGGVYVASNGVANFQGCNIHDNTHIWKVCTLSSCILNFHPSPQCTP